MFCKVNLLFTVIYFQKHIFILCETIRAYNLTYHFVQVGVNKYYGIIIHKLNTHYLTYIS